MRSNKLKREGAIRETQEEKRKTKGNPTKNETKNKKKKIDSLTSYPGPKYNTAQNIYKRFYKNILHIDKSQAL